MAAAAAAIVLLVASFLSQAPRALQQAPINQQQQQQEQQELELDRYAFQVDTKHWIRSLELADPSNWLDNRKPCSPYQRIQFPESVALSMGDSLDSLGNLLEYGPKELLLASTGLLLLPEDSLSELADAVDLLAPLDQPGQSCYETPDEEHLFRLEPHPDSLSWFNPQNWYSELQDQVQDYIPESYRVPCVEDIVQFGGSPDIRRSGHSSTGHSFKVNFRAHSEAQPSVGGAAVAGVRIAKLKIGQHFYSQPEFDALPYRDLLFEFHSNHSLLAADNAQQVTIDESSIRAEVAASATSGQQLCNDPAGCLCGNDEPPVLAAICSFVEPLKEHEFACLDPITTPGYCDKICGTTLTIHFDPIRFSESLITVLLHSSLADIPDEKYKSIFIGHRRMSHTRYQIILYPSLDEAGDGPGNSLAGKQLEEGHKVIRYVNERLSSDAIKSFYGIKGSTIESSVKWRRDNRVTFFWTSFVVWALIATGLFIYGQQKESARAESAQKRQPEFSIGANPMYQLQEVWTQVVRQYRRLTTGTLTRNGSESTIHSAEATNFSQAATFEIQLNELMD